MVLTVGLLFSAEWTSVVLQSLRPNIHTSVGTRWVNSKAAAVNNTVHRTVTRLSLKLSPAAFL